MRRALLLAFLLMAPAAFAQDDESPGFFGRLFGTDRAASDEEQGTLLERLIQDSLSGSGRTVRVEGFSGALSGQATLDQLTIADDEGIWLTLTDATLDWSRAALFSGRLEVADISAASIELPRLPVPSATMEPPSPEASGFQLPELPVSVNIGRIAAENVQIGAPVIGVAASVSVEGSLSLADGDGAADLEIARLDGRGALSLEAGYANATEQLGIDLSLQEAEGGILATLIGLPGRPAVDFNVTGDAPLSEFVADIGLATDGEKRLAGQVRLGRTEDARTVVADIGGDIAPVFAPEYRDFFGDQIALRASALLYDDGRIGVPELSLTARELTLEGNLELGSDGLPQLIDLTGRIAPETGEDVLLPLAGGETRIGLADISVQFDAAQSEDWTGRISVERLERPDFGAEAMTLTGAGRIRAGLASELTADLDFAAQGIESGIDGLAEALGRDVEGSATVRRTGGEPVLIEDLRLSGAALTLVGNAQVGAKLRSEGALRVTADRVADFSTLAGRALAGSAVLDTTFRVAPFDRSFDVTAKGETRDLALSDPYADPLLAGLAELDLTAARDENGLRLDLRRLASEAARVTGKLDLRSGGSTATADVALTDISLLLPEIEGPANFTFTGQEDPERNWRVTADLEAQSLKAVASGAARGLYTENPSFEGQVTLDAGNLAAFAEIAGRPLTGQLRLTAEGRADSRLSIAVLEAEAEGAGLSIGDQNLDKLLVGPLAARITGSKVGEAISVSNLEISTDALRATGSGQLIRDEAQVMLDAAVEDVSAFSGFAGRDLAGRLEIKGEGEFVTDLTRGSVTADVRGSGLSLGDPQLDPLLAGAFQATVDGSRNGDNFEVTQFVVSSDLIEATGSGRLTGDEAQANVEARVADLAPLSGVTGRPLTGQVALTADAAFVKDFSHVKLTADIEGSGLSVGRAEADRLLRGTLTANVTAERDGDTIQVDAFRFATDLLTASASGRLAEAGSELDVEARLADLSPFVAGFSGPLSVDGTIGRSDGRLALNLDASGPGGASARLDGTLAEDLSAADLGMNGSAPLGLADRFIAPMSIAGPAGFNLRLSGPLVLESVSGQITTSGARLAAPTLNTALREIAGNVSLSGGRAQVDLVARVEGGGRLAVTGPVALSAPYAAGIEAVLRNVAVSDPRFFETRVSGRIGIDGPLTGGARIGGQLTLGETNIRIPSTGLGGSGEIPEITHINEPPPVRGTRQRAGLLSSKRDDAGGGGPVYALDIAIEAPNRIFVRGRGLDSEFGGRLRVTGTTADVVPIGAFDLIRGRLDILSRRLDLEEARITIQGGFIPYLRIRASTQTEEYNVGVDVVGPADDPEITFRSIPELPQEEVLSRLIFGRGIDTLSPLQAARLALAVRTLAGGGGEGVVDKIRGGAGLADLDVSTTEDGNTAVRAGAYVGENIYTDVTVDSAGETKLQLNLDITRSLTARGGVSNDGESSLGIFFERDY
jgi:translocation and assembly module TamB